MNSKNIVGIFLTFIVLFSFWIFLSGLLDAMHLSMGIICSILVALYSHDLLIRGSDSIIGRAGILTRFIKYGFWLLFQIFIANIDVARRVLDPKMPISPGIIKFSSRLKSDVALTTLANSITLTPGTMTMDIIDGDYYVHCLATEHGENLLKGDFEKHMEHVFGEGER
ncbi:MAG: Na+/H+ antiporter subunit E [Methanocellales archaeon]|nr:Na+/H+ antiporter subunit E [Methanocellales archaeon]